jgi:hypothetical protein
MNEAQLMICSDFIDQKIGWVFKLSLDTLFHTRNPLIHILTYLLFFFVQIVVQTYTHFKMLQIIV